MKNILITSSLSNDMIKPIRVGEMLPHKLHIGYQEMVRLLGEDFTKGPLINFLKDCEKTSPNDLSIIHVRDWHSLDDPAQLPELRKYGPHCMAKTVGAEFIWEGQNILGNGENKPQIYNSSMILAATEPGFKSLLESIIQDTPKEEVKIGIIGLLTNIKVMQKAIALQGYYGLSNIAVCSALTASNNRRKHFEALDDMDNIYGIKIISSTSEFSDWLAMKTRPLFSLGGFDTPRIDSQTTLSAEQKKVIEYLYRECKSVSLKEMTGGFSGSKVYLSQGTEKTGHSQLPNVLKLDSREMIGKEIIGFEKVQHVLGPHVPKVVDYVETDTQAAIRYSFAMMNKTDVPMTFQKFYSTLKATPQDISLLEKSLNLLFEEIIKPMSANSHVETTNLWGINTFCTRYADSTISKMRHLGVLQQAQTVEIAGVTLPNPEKFYFHEEIEKRLREPPSYVKRSLAHGDLNAANILLDSRQNMWVLDFFHTHYDHHVIQDLVKFENDIKFIHTKIRSEEELRAMIAYEKALVSQKSLDEEVVLPQGLVSPEVIKLHKTVSMLRKFAYAISQDANMRNYNIPLLRYSAHTLSFSECDALQKKYALASTAILCDSLSN